MKQVENYPKVNCRYSGSTNVQVRTVIILPKMYEKCQSEKTLQKNFFHVGNCKNTETETEMIFF